MMGQPNVPEEAQEKMQTLQELQQTHEDTLQALEQHKEQYESIVEAQSFLEQTDDETNVYRQVDDLLFELDYEEAEEHVQQRMDKFESNIEQLEDRHEQLEDRMEELGQQVQDIMGEEQTGQ